MQISPDLAEFSQDTHAGPPSRLGKRYSTTKFLPEAGNTVVCALDLQDSSHQLILNARALMMALPQAEHFIFTPVSSLHMTVFDGVIETERARGSWPEGMDTSLPIKKVSQALVPRLKDFSAPEGFDVAIQAMRPTGLVLRGATSDDEAKMRAWREGLTAPFGFRRKTHDSYQFHMTFGYPLKWLSPDVLPVWQVALDELLGELKQNLPVISLEAPAFCEFADMTAFAPRVRFTD